MVAFAQRELVGNLSASVADSSSSRSGKSASIASPVAWCSTLTMRRNSCTWKLCVPSGITGVEQRAVQEAAGAWQDRCVLSRLAAEGRIVRGRPRGTWVSSQHRWAPVEAWFPGGLPELLAGATVAIVPTDLKKQYDIREVIARLVDEALRDIPKIRVAVVNEAFAEEKPQEVYVAAAKVGGELLAIVW